MDSFCLVLELHRRGFATDGATRLVIKQFALLKKKKPFSHTIFTSEMVKSVCKYAKTDVLKH